MFDYIHKSDVIKAQTVTVPRVLFSSLHCPVQTSPIHVASKW